MEIRVDHEGIAKVGEWIMHRNKMRKIIGYAIGADGRGCYVSTTDCDSEGWLTRLAPFDEVTRKFAEADVAADTSALLPCDGCMDEDEHPWKCSLCTREKKRTDNYRAKADEEVC